MSMDPTGRRLRRRPTCWSRARRSSPSGRTCRRAAPTEIDARGRIVMPGFIDTHHHQFETALRSFLADGILINDGSGTPSGEHQLLRIHPAASSRPVYRPQDVYINELFGGLSQLDAGVTTVHDISQIHHSPQHSDAAIQALIDTGRRAAFGYFESAGGVRPATSIRRTRAASRSSGSPRATSSSHMIMGGEVYLGEPTTRRPGRSGASSGCRSRRTSCRRSASARPSTSSPRARRRQRQHRARTRQPVHPHDRDVGHGLAEGQGRRRAGLARRSRSR